MINFAAKLLLNAEVQMERDHAKSISQKTLLYNDVDAMPLYLLLPSAELTSYQMEPPTHYTASLKLAISYTGLCRFYGLTSRMFAIRKKFTLSISH